MSRFPTFLAIDLRATKEVSFIGKRFRVGVQLFNLTSHFNPRDVISNLASPDFGQFKNSRDLSAGLRIQFDF